MTDPGAGPAISSPRHPLVLEASRLRRSRARRESGRTLVEGPILVAAAATGGCRFDRIFGLASDVVGREVADEVGCPFVVVDAAALAKVATTQHPQSPVAVVTIPEESITPGKRALVAWGVGDPGNCGTLIRTAAAFGYDYFAGPGAAETWSPKVLRAAAGAHFHTGIGRAATLEQLGAGRVLVAAVARGGTPPGPLPGNAAILVGSEPHGLDAEVVAACGMAVTIPMAEGSESLNAAVAGAIVAFLGASGPGANLTPS